MYRAALRVGLGSRTRIHGLGDGAKWIVDQMKRVFLKQVEYLIDFFHVTEYLATAAEYGWTSEKETWRRTCQELLKQNKSQEVISKIRVRLPVNWEEQKEENKGEEKNPIEKCFCYMNNRKDNFNYKSAIERELPIGSGEIESGHRHVIQKRLKIAGAWWRPETAQHMLDLRVLRANNDWGDYWMSQAGQDAA